MEKEAFFSGYCRCTDGSRTVMAEKEGHTLLDVDCGYPGCVYAPNCPIAQKIKEFLSE